MASTYDDPKRTVKEKVGLCWGVHVGRSSSIRGARSHRHRPSRRSLIVEEVACLQSTLKLFESDQDAPTVIQDTHALIPLSSTYMLVAASNLIRKAECSLSSFVQSRVRRVSSNESGMLSSFGPVRHSNVFVVAFESSRPVPLGRHSHRTHLHAHSPLVGSCAPKPETRPRAPTPRLSIYTRAAARVATFDFLFDLRYEVSTYLPTGRYGGVY